MAITYNNLYLDIRQQLHQAGLPAATLEARELVCCAAGKSREELSRASRLYVPDAVEQQARALVQRHLEGEPVAYLIGEWEFYGLPLDISERVLIPRPDTEVLAAAAIEGLQGVASPRVLDLCAGSGCVGLAVAKHVSGSHMVLGEIDEGALRICRQNIRRTGLSGQVVSMQLNALEKAPPRLGEFDCIVSNPPYIPTADIEALDPSVRNHEPHLALDGGADGLDFYRVIADKWRDALLPNGLMAFEVGIGQADEVLRIMRANGFGDIQIVKDLHGIPRVVYGRLCKEI